MADRDDNKRSSTKNIRNMIKIDVQHAKQNLSNSRIPSTTSQMMSELM